jgi:hypothetical protein
VQTKRERIKGRGREKDTVREIYIEAERMRQREGTECVNRLGLFAITVEGGSRK